MRVIEKRLINNNQIEQKKHRNIKYKYILIYNLILSTNTSITVYITIENLYVLLELEFDINSAIAVLSRARAVQVNDYSHVLSTVCHGTLNLNLS